MTALRFIIASLRHYRRIHVAVALGVAVATAVLTGALLVGDSVRGSLRDLTLQRLGRIDSALVAPHLFRAALAEELAADASFQKHFTAAEPAILTSGTLQSGGAADTRRATAVSVIGCRAEFWSLGHGGPKQPLAEDQIALTELLARELNVEAGNDVLLRIPVAGAIPTDSPLGNKKFEKISNSRQLKVAAVLPHEGLARFGLTPTQHVPRNVFVPLPTLQ
ncbi:MAG: ABC transporter permease, partial [Pirellulales bacterium]